MAIFQNTGPSAAMLAEYLGVDLVMPYRNQDTSKRYHREASRGRMLPVPINFGCARKYVELSSINYNSESIKDKLYCFEIFSALGIKFPALIKNPQEYDKVFIGRKNNSSQGKGIVKYKPKSSNWDKHGSDFFVEFVDGASEHRVHVWGNDILIELNKDFSSNKHDFIRNYHNGSKLVPGYINHPKRLEILDACIKATDYCGLTFGAIDIIIDKNGEWYFLEINSSPRLSRLYAMIYAQHINRIYNLGVEFDRFIDLKETTSKKIDDSFYYNPAKKIDKKLKVGNL